MSNKVSFAKNFITKQLDIRLLVVVDGDEDNTSVAEEFLGYAQAFRHERQPLGVTVAVFGVDVGVVIDEVFVAGVVGRIDVDDVDFSGVGIGQGGEGFEVVALYDDVVRIVNFLIIST